MCLILSLLRHCILIGGYDDDISVTPLLLTDSYVLCCHFQHFICNNKYTYSSVTSFVCIEWQTMVSLGASEIPPCSFHPPALWLFPSISCQHFYSLHLWYFCFLSLCYFLERKTKCLLFSVLCAWKIMQHIATHFK